MPWIDKFVRRELKQRHPDSLCETESFHHTRHLTSRCYSWHPGRQHCAGRYKVLRVGVEPATLVNSATPPRYQLYGLIRDTFCICRACGQVFCRDCTKQKIPLPQFGYMNPERVCENCYQRNTVRQADEEVGFCLSVRPGTDLFNFWFLFHFIVFLRCQEAKPPLPRTPNNQLSFQYPRYLHSLWLFNLPCLFSCVCKHVYLCLQYAISE